MPELTKLQADFIEKLRTKDIDLNGRKIINSGAPVNDDDLMSKQAVLDLLRELGLI